MPRSKKPRKNPGGGVPRVRQCSEYGIWRGMRQRCSDPNEPRYGGRGIKVCERWENSFAAFYEDMGPRPSKDHSLDRYPNRNGDYEPDNCRWATPKEQQDNRDIVQFVEFRGETLSLTDWAKRNGMRPHTLYYRIKAGWSFERAISTPVEKRKYLREPLLDPDILAAWIEKSRVIKNNLHQDEISLIATALRSITKEIN